MLVSAVTAGGPPASLIDMALEGRIEVVVPVPVLTELWRVLARKFEWSESRLRDLSASLAELASERPEPPQRVEDVTGHPPDDLILACAVAAGVEALVSGDHRHMLPVGEHHGIRILTPQALLAELHAQDEG